MCQPGGSVIAKSPLKLPYVFVSAINACSVGARLLLMFIDEGGAGGVRMSS